MISAHVRLEDGAACDVTYKNTTFEPYTETVLQEHDASQVEYLWITRKNPAASFAVDTLVARFAQNFQDATKLEHLSVDWYNNECNVETLDQIIQVVAMGRPNNVKSLFIRCKTLIGSDEVWEQLDQCIQTHLCSLESLDISCDDEIDNVQGLDSAVLSFFSIPSLQSVELKVPGLSLSPRTLQSLSRCKGFAELHMDDAVLNDDHILALANALQATTSLFYLEIRVSSQLETPTASARALSGMLRGMQKAIQVQISSSSSELQDEFLLEMAAGMPSTVNCLAYHFNLSDNALDAHATMVEDNYTLERFWFGPDDSVPFDKIQFYVALNRIGRAKVMVQDQDTKGASPERWVDVIAEATQSGNDGFGDFAEEEDVLSTVFYLLSQNPHLCDLVPRIIG